MYLPQHFEMSPERAEEIIAQHPLAALVVQDDTGLICNHIPMRRVGQSLLGHIARGSDFMGCEDHPCIAVFTAAEGYISPNWYPSKAETHEAVPTWNYEVVHVHGRLSVVEDEAGLRRFLHQLTQAHDRAVNGDKAWKMADAPTDFLQAKLDDIALVTVSIERIEGKAKLSQNKSEADRLEAAKNAQPNALGQAMRNIQGAGAAFYS